MEARIEVSRIEIKGKFNIHNLVRIHSFHWNGLTHHFGS